MEEKIIVQDTYKDNLEMLTIALEAERYIVLPLSSCENILTYISTFVPSLIMLDFKFKGEDAIEACRQIKGLNSGLPVFALSCNCNISREYRKYGFDCYIIKPYDLDDTYRLIRQYIGKQ